VKSKKNDQTLERVRLEKNPFRVCRKNTFGLIVKKFFARICLVTSFSMTSNDFSFPVFCDF